jgi:hypothetical protein
MAYNWTSSTIFSSPTYQIGGQSLYALDNNNLFIFFTDWNTGLYFAKSTDGGITWSTPVLVESGEVWTWGIRNRSIWVSSNGQTIYLTYNWWITEEPYPQTIKFAKSIDGGSSFSVTTLISGDDIYVSNSAIDVYGSTGEYIYIVYSQEVPNKICLVYSTDSGSNWTTKIVRSGINATGFLYNIKALSTSKIYISGNFSTTSSWGCWFAKTSDSGDTWAYTDTGLVYDSMLGDALYVKDENTIFIAICAASTVKFLQSTNGGSSFTSVQIDSVRGYAISMWSVANILFVAYPVSGGSQYFLKISYSNNDGVSWINENADTFVGCGYNPSLWVGSTNVFTLHNTGGALAVSCRNCLRLTKIISSLPISSILMYKFRPVVLK